MNKDHPKVNFGKTGVLLINLGTPESTSWFDIRKYLKEFLSDKRVIEVNPILWKFILNVFILTFRPSKTAKAYKEIWMEKENMSPLRYYTKLQAEKIEDRPDNTTRFLIVGREKADISGEDKTSILVSSRDKPGALYQLLQPFHQADISLTRIETRPSRSAAWNYVFFIDFEGHQNDPVIQKILTEMAEWASDVKILGSYPKAVL